MIRRLVLVLALVSLAAGTASAGTFADPQAAGFRPRVPVSALGALGSWFDPSRLHMSNTFTVGSGWGGSAANALNVTSFSYQFRAPLTMNVSVGNSFGPGASSRTAAFFLEGLDLTYHPSANSTFQIQYRDVRSPLQYGNSGLSGPARGYWGY
jgi:hypothetical protein